MFTRIHAKMIQFDLRIYFNWAGSTTNQCCCVVFVVVSALLLSWVTFTWFSKPELAEVAAVAAVALLQHWLYRSVLLSTGDGRKHEWPASRWHITLLVMYIPDGVGFPSSSRNMFYWINSHKRHEAITLCSQCTLVKKDGWLEHALCFNSKSTYN